MDNGSTKGSFVIDIPVKDFLHLDIFPNPNKKYMYVDGSRSIGDGVLFFYAGIELFGVNNTVSSILFQFVFIDSKENCHFQKEYPMNHQFIFQQQ